MATVKPSSGSYVGISANSSQLTRRGLFFPLLDSLGGVRLSPLGTSATVGLLYQPRMIDDYGAVGGMRIGRGNRSTRRKPAPVPLCPPQILHYMNWDRSRAAAVGSQRLSIYGTARRGRHITINFLIYAYVLETALR
jgi:hypothetical protein